MGEEKWRVHQTGSLANDSIKGIEFLTIEDIRKLFPAASKQGYFLVTQHPETMARAQVATQINAVLTALKGYGLPVVFTYPNLDAANKTIIKAVENFVGKNKNSLLIKNAGRQLYYSLVKHAAAVVGNSSSGIYDTPYLKIPAVNIGHRQDGRLKAANVIDVGYDPAAIQRALKKSASPAFHASLDHAIQGFFGRGDAASQMVRVFEGLGLDKSLLIKKFVSTGKSHRV